jgi:hypothetical protein
VSWNCWARASGTSDATSNGSIAEKECGVLVVEGKRRTEYGHLSPLRSSADQMKDESPWASVAYSCLEHIRFGVRHSRLRRRRSAHLYTASPVSLCYGLWKAGRSNLVSHTSTQLQAVRGMPCISIGLAVAAKPLHSRVRAYHTVAINSGFGSKGKTRKKRKRYSAR